MSCRVVRMSDGSVVLANVKAGSELSEADKAAISEWVQFCRDRRKRNADLLSGSKGGKKNG